MAINEKLIVQEAAAGVDADPNIMLDLNAGDVDSYDGDGDVWYDIHDFEFKPTTNVSEHFNTVTYTGNDGINEITGVGFQPDLVWIKRRNSSTYNHVIRDSVRGTDSVLSSNTSSAETVASNRFEFLTDGFKHLAGTQGANNSAGTYVAWCFNAGGNEVTNTEGTIDSTVRANNDLGFSIVKWSGDGSSATVGHGLDTPPELTIKKNLDYVGDWAVNTYDRGGHYMYLNKTDAESSSSQSVTSTTFTASGTTYNRSGTDLIAYCFTSKRGVSKVGSYIGTGASGNKIYTGFEPAFVMWKNADNSASNSMWFMFDNVRGESAYLMANSSSIEGTDASVQFHRDGFTVPNAGAINNSGQTHIYYAVAKNTNETSLHNTNLELNLEADSYSGSGNWLDSSGNGNNGIITGATWEEELGNYFDLDGSGDYIDASTSGVLSGDFTVEMWWNFDSFNGYRMLFGGSGYSSGTGLGHYINGDDFATWVSVNGSPTNVLNISASDLTTNKWQHIVLTRSGSTYTMYVDGNQVGQGSGTTASLESANSRIGGHYNIASTYDLDAKVGQVRLYGAALSQAQIRQNYNFTKPKYPNEFHGDIIGTPSWNTEGSFNISGGNYINLGSDKAINFTTNSSISVWVNSSNSTGSKGILGRFNNTSPYGYILYQNSGNVGFSLYDSSGNGSFTATTPLTNSTWTHFAVTYDGSNLILYKNGTSVSNVASTRIPSTPSANTLIGRYYSNVNVTTYDFAGKISKVKFYNTAITASEVDTLYNEGQ